MSSYLGKRKVILSQVLSKKREIEDEISNVKVKLETTNNELSVVSNSLADKLHFLEEIEEKFDGINDDLESFGRAVHEITKNGVEHLARLNVLMEVFGKTLLKIDEKIAARKKIFEEFEKKQKAILKDIESQGAIMEKRRVDLGIYKNRLEKKIKEYGLEKEIKIVLP